MIGNASNAVSREELGNPHTLTIGEQADRLRQSGSRETLTSEVRLLNDDRAELHSSHIQNVGEQMRGIRVRLFCQNDEVTILADKEGGKICWKA
jgi:hypothetical protein